MAFYTATNTLVATVPVGSDPVGVAITPDGAFAYVTNIISNNVSVINTVTNTVVATVAVGINPLGVAISPSACREDDGEDVEGEGHGKGDDGHEKRDDRHHKRKRPCKGTGEMDFDRR